jgi:uncharacterized membrane protein
MSSLQFQHPERWWIACLWAALMSLLLWRAYRRVVMPAWQRNLAIAAKAIALMLIGVCLLDPVRVTDAPIVGANEVIILADNSASLSIAEQSGAEPRSAQLRAALGSDSGMWAEWLERLRATFRVQIRAVDAQSHAVSSANDLSFVATQSRLARAVMLARDRQTSSVAAVVVLSDGQAQDADAWQAKSGDAPVYTVLVGRSPPQGDLAVIEASAVANGFEDAPVLVTAKVRQSGYAEREIAIIVANEAGKVIMVEKHRFAADQAEHLARLRVPVIKAGLSFLTVATMAADIAPKLGQDFSPKAIVAETIVQNNQRQLAVDRGAGPYRILYVGGRPNWEHKFMRRAIAKDLDLQLPSLLRIAKREPKFEWRGRTGESSNPLFRGFAGDQQHEAQRYDQPVLQRLGTRDAKELIDGFPKTAELLMGEYRAIILDDVEAAFFTQEQQLLIERFVSERGGSVLMLGGADSFQAGGYDKTPIARVLPVYLDRPTVKSAVENASLQLTREGLLEPWARLRSDQAAEEQRQAAMPTFYSVNQCYSIKPGASVIATLNRDDGQSFPAMVTQRYGNGRGVAMTVGDVWRWGMKDKDNHGDMDKAWRQWLRQLVIDVPDRIALRCEVDAASQTPLVKLELRARDAAFAPQDDASVQFEITGPGGAMTKVHGEPSTSEPGLFTADYYPGSDGAYRVKANTKIQGDPVDQERISGFVSQAEAEEWSQLAPNAAFLAKIAQDTGGEVIAINDIAMLADRLPSLDSPKKAKQSSPVWHHPFWLALILGLLVSEWGLRRSAGL